jgi:membrane protein
MLKETVRSIHSVAVLLRNTIEECLRDNTPMLAAALAFYGLLSLAPLSIVIVAVTGMWFGRASAEAEIAAKTQEVLGPVVAEVVSGVLRQAREHSSVATIAGVVSLLFGATVVFSALTDSLNTVWHVPARGRNYVVGFLTRRLVSFGVVLLLGVVLVASLVLSAIIAAAGAWVPQSLPASESVLQWANFAVTFAAMTVMFALIFKLLPDAEIKWRDLWVGAAVTALLFTVGKTLIGLYLGHTTAASAYGAAGSLVVFLLWVYYSAQIFLFGAEFTQTYANAHGAGVNSEAAPFSRAL